MQEQSHKSEMADALRGDFARLRARGVATTLDATVAPEPAEAVSDTRSEPPGEPRTRPVRAGWLARAIRRS